MPDAPKDEAFLSRWSRRKRTEPVEEALPQVEQAIDGEKTDEELLAELDLPDPDTMKPEDDFSAFMSKRVPERLRRRALRVLWRSNPVLANLDELVDYGEDFTDSATVIENMQTVYEVGKGAAEKWKRHLAALAEEETDKDDMADATPPPTTITETPPEPPQNAGKVPEAGPVPAAQDHAQTVQKAPLSPRPARFSFE